KRSVTEMSDNETDMDPSNGSITSLSAPLTSPRTTRPTARPDLPPPLTSASAPRPPHLRLRRPPLQQRALANAASPRHLTTRPTWTCPMVRPPLSPPPLTSLRANAQKTHPAAFYLPPPQALDASEAR